jgi:hypothetical protein
VCCVELDNSQSVKSRMLMMHEFSKDDNGGEGREGKKRLKTK